MKKNVGGLDRIFRGIAGAALLAWGVMAQNWWGAVGAVLLFTAAVSWCPPYALLGISTRKEEKETV